MKVKNTSFYIKVPKHVSIIYSRKKKIITILGVLNTKSLKLHMQLFLVKSKNIIKISLFSFFKSSNNKRKKLKSAQGTIRALLKQLIFETCLWLYKKLKLVGVGYKIFVVYKFENKVLLFKLGCSHNIYFKIPPKIKIFCLKTAQLFIYGNSYKNVTQTALKIRMHKKPEPYKGKGFLYSNEIIKLKEGKKV